MADDFDAAHIMQVQVLDEGMLGDSLIGGKLAHLPPSIVLVIILLTHSAVDLTAAVRAAVRAVVRLIRPPNTLSRQDGARSVTGPHEPRPPLPALALALAGKQAV